MPANLPLTSTNDVVKSVPAAQYAVAQLPARKNEDRFIAYNRPIAGLFDCLLGIMDGHNGAGAAEFIQMYLVDLLKENTQKRLEAGEAELFGWSEMANRVLTQVFEELDTAVIDSLNDGTTCTLLLIKTFPDVPDVHLKVAWVGDSRAVAINPNNDVHSDLTQDHRADNKDEQKRIYFNTVNGITTNNLQGWRESGVISNQEMQALTDTSKLLHKDKKFVTAALPKQQTRRNSFAGGKAAAMVARQSNRSATVHGGSSALSVLQDLETMEETMDRLKKSNAQAGDTLRREVISAWEEPVLDVPDDSVRIHKRRSSQPLVKVLTDDLVHIIESEKLFSVHAGDLNSIVLQSSCKDLEETHAKEMSQRRNEKSVGSPSAPQRPGARNSFSRSVHAGNRGSVHGSMSLHKGVRDAMLEAQQQGEAVLRGSPACDLQRVSGPSVHGNAGFARGASVHGNSKLTSAKSEGNFGGSFHGGGSMKDLAVMDSLGSSTHGGGAFMPAPRFNAATPSMQITNRQYGVLTAKASNQDLDNLMVNYSGVPYTGKYLTAKGEMVGNERVFLPTGVSVMNTRCIGDRTCKEGTSNAVISKPDFSDLVVVPGDWTRVVMASDGLWDVLSSAKVAKMNKGRKDVHKACKKTVNSCKDQCDYGGMVRDDITVIMLDVDLRGEDLSGSMRGLTPSSSMNSMEGLGVSNVQSIKMLDQRAADEGTEKDKQPKCGCTIQ